MPLHTSRNNKIVAAADTLSRKDTIVNATLQAQNAYSSAASPVRTNRNTELQLFSKTTASLKTAAAKLPDSYPEFVSALHDNRKVWTHLAAEIADSDNELPKDLRARLFYLAEFTDHQTRLILNGEADASILIEINTSVIRGLGRNEVSQ